MKMLILEDSQLANVIGGEGAILIQLDSDRAPDEIITPHGEVFPGNDRAVKVGGGGGGMKA